MKTTVLLDAADELHKLRKHFKLLIAGQYGKSLGKLLSNNNLINLFENSLTQDDFNITKPDPRYFERITSRAKINPEHCIMVGDRIDKDVIPARQNNMGTVFLRTGIYRNQKPRTPEELTIISENKEIIMKKREIWKNKIEK